jgi:hypothetical protein
MSKYFSILQKALKSSLKSADDSVQESKPGVSFDEDLNQNLLLDRYRFGG